MYALHFWYNEAGYLLCDELPGPLHACALYVALESHEACYQISERFQRFRDYSCKKPQHQNHQLLWFWVGWEQTGPNIYYWARFLIADGAMSWKSKKQSIVAQNLQEGEYLTLSSTVREDL